MNPRRPAALALAAALLSLTGCASTGTGPSTPATTSATPGPATVTVDEHADRTTVRIAVGATLTLALHSTYWSAATSSAPEVLAADGAPSTAPSPSCRPGGGCGTVTAAFTARAAGTARLTATRTSCGEALNCPPGQRSYEVTVDVEG
ncbi:hypothetical protein ACGF13_10440 [Kitasatospora sp. NPDC048286]|uniref:hypothetical protein n=1 Tax=unclassified Kitasatospora TaxID=2633591 RepID=UPI003718ADDF